MLSTPKARWLIAAAVLALAAACASQATAPITATPPSAASPARESAAAFVARAETELAAMSEEGNRADWTRQTNITYDTNWLSARIGARINERTSALAKEAAAYPTAGLDPVVARKLELLKRGSTLPAPARAGAAQEMADIGTRLEAAYATGTFPQTVAAIHLGEPRRRFLGNKIRAQPRAIIAQRAADDLLHLAFMEINAGTEHVARIADRTTDRQPANLTPTHDVLDCGGKSDATPLSHARRPARRSQPARAHENGVASDFPSHCSKTVWRTRTT